MKVSRFFHVSTLSFVLLLAGCTEKAAESSFTPRSVDYNGLMQEISSRKGDIVIVNFWATWCMPCRVEFPDFVRFGKEFADQGVDIVFVSTDYEPDMPNVIDFLEENGVPWESYIKTGVDFKFITSFHSEWSGALPATFVYDRKGALRVFWEGMTSFDELENTVKVILES